MSVTGLYNDDFALWAAETARLLRAGRFDEVDVEHCVANSRSRLSEPAYSLRNAMVFTPDTSKRLRQRRFLHAALSSSRTM
jgi:Domain of unknown function DUF29